MSKSWQRWQCRIARGSDRSWATIAPVKSSLPDTLQAKIEEWRNTRYKCEYLAVREIFEYLKTTNYLRAAQFRALEVYLFLRCVENTPHIKELYKQLFSAKELREALGIPTSEEISDLMAEGGIHGVLDTIASDESFAKRHHLDALHETLTLDYPSYILALAMGAGKTMLIGTIIAVEFALAMEYPEATFIANALVFAPGKTILVSLRELSDVDYKQILPPRLSKSFLASVKFVYTRDGEKDIPVVRGSLFNLIVTNTEKIRIQKPTVRKAQQSIFEKLQKEEEAQELANLRLQAIASLPHLGIFSDEAHHTYGQKMEQELKKVRKTVDYLAANTNVLCVINTTGTPYFKRQFLRDVVIWYGLGEGIEDGILKEVSGNIHSFTVADDAVNQYIQEVLGDFFTNYADVRLPNGAMAKIALYFPTQEALNEARAVIEKELVRLGQTPDIVLMNTQKSTPQELEAFNNLNNPSSDKRVILLIDKGTEGWNCPSLFATALIRKLTSSNNFVLQAATRCLRQIPGNTAKASIYLSHDNRSVLEKELVETYGSSLSDLDRTMQERITAKIVVRKMNIPPLIVKKLMQKIVEKEKPSLAFSLKMPSGSRTGMQKSTHTISQSEGKARLDTTDSKALKATEELLDAYKGAVELSGQTHLESNTLYKELRRVYGREDIPIWHLTELRQQIEEQVKRYEIAEEEVEEALAILKLDGFQKETTGGETVYTTLIHYPKSREHLLLKFSDLTKTEQGQIGFHYEPYNFDSEPEKNFFMDLLSKCNEEPANVEDIYFTGGITSKDKTDFAVEYQDTDGVWHSYTPDFLIRLKSGKCVIVEIKSEKNRTHPIDGEKGNKAEAVRKWQEIDPDTLSYEIIFASTDRVEGKELQSVYSHL